MAGQHSTFLLLHVHWVLLMSLSSSAHPLNFLLPCLSFILRLLLYWKPYRLHSIKQVTWHRVFQVARKRKTLYSLFASLIWRILLHCSVTFWTELSVDVRDFSFSWDSQATNMEMALSWDVVPCSLVDIYRRFRGSYCLHQHRDTNQDRILLTMCGIAPPLNHKILPKNR